MRNADPENEVGDVQRPEDRPVDSPDSKPSRELIGERSGGGKHDEPAHCDRRVPAAPGFVHRPEKVGVNLGICWSSFRHQLPVEKESNRKGAWSSGFSLVVRGSGRVLPG